MPGGAAGWDEEERGPGASCQAAERRGGVVEQGGDRPVETERGGDRGTWRPGGVAERCVGRPRHAKGPRLTSIGMIVSLIPYPIRSRVAWVRTGRFSSGI